MYIYTFFFSPYRLCRVLLPSYNDLSGTTSNAYTQIFTEVHLPKLVLKTNPCSAWEVLRTSSVFKANGFSLPGSIRNS